MILKTAARLSDYSCQFIGGDLDLATFRFFELLDCGQSIFDAYMSGLPARKTLACREDILARGVPLPRPDSITMPDDFYGQLVKDIMENPDKIYVF